MWTNLTGGLWSNPTNWSPNQVPAGADRAFITNAGTYTVTNNGAAGIGTPTLTVGADFIQTGGSANLGTNFTVNGNTRIESGAFNGRGAIGGYFYNNGVSGPGAPLGNITAATFTNTGPATLNIELGGTSGGTNYDQVRLTGAANLNGALNISFANSFTPAPGNIFTAMTFTARSGVFSSDNVTTRGLTIQYSGTNVLLLADNVLPGVALVSPSTSIYSNCICEPVVFLATASDPDGISNVTFYVDSNPVGVVSNVPYRAVWSTDVPGLHTFTATARDNRGGETTTNLTVRFGGRGGTNVLNPYLVTAAILTNVPVIPKFSVKLCLEDEPGRDYDVEAMTNMMNTNWGVIGQLTFTNSQWTYYDTNATNYKPERYYHAVRLPRVP